MGLQISDAAPAWRSLYRATLVLTMLSVSRVCLAQPAPESLEDAIAQVAAIKDPDPYKQDRLKAESAFKMVTDRIKIINDISGTALQTLPVDVWNYFTSCSNIKARAEALEVARAKGWDLARASWLLRAGACDENSSLMKEILTRAGVKNVVILRSSSPHAFPVVGLAPDADPDIPWTWGERAFVPDTWSRKLYPPPLDIEAIWNSSLYFNSGDNYVSPGAHTTTRELLASMAKKGPDFIKQHCNEYRPAMGKFMRIPEKYRLKMNLKPPPVEDVCPVADWAGTTWYGFRGRSLYDISLKDNALAVRWVTDGAPEGEYYDCNLTGAMLEIADCKWKQVGLPGGTAHLVFTKEAHGDRISGQTFDGEEHWPVDIWRDAP